MSAPRSRRTRLAWAAAIIAAAGSAACAAEKEDKFVPITQPRDDTAISTTKREFDTIKSSRDPALQQKADVPRFTVPEMPASGAGTGWTPPKANLPEKKSANWLLEAMDQQQAADRKSQSRDKPERGRERDEVARAADDARKLENGSTPRRETDPEASDAREGERKSTSAAANPLTRYLGEWMTPQDYSLLKPSLLDSASVKNARDVTTPSVLNLPANSLANLGNVAAPAAAAAPANLPAKPRENPFLQSLNPPAPGASSPPPIVNAPPPPPRSAPSMPGVLAPAAVPTEPAKSAVPDFVKPAQDEKYFKPLKRF